MISEPMFKLSGAASKTLAILSLSALVWSAGCSDSDEPPKTNPTVDMNKDVDMPSEDMKPSVDMKMPEDMGKDMTQEPTGSPVEARGFALMPPIPTSCDDPSGSYRIPFVISTEQVRPAVAGDTIAGRALIPNKTVNSGSLATRRTRIAQLADRECATNADCGAGFACSAAGLANAQRRCVSQTGLEFVPGTMRMDYDPGNGQKRQLITLLMENSGSLTGYLPKDTGELYGEDGQKDLFELALRATDKGLTHRETISQFIIQMASVVSSANTRFSAWWFAGDNAIEGVRPITNTDSNTQNDYYTSDLSELMGKLGPGQAIPAPSNRLGTANVYQAILRAVEKDLGLSKYDDYEKFLVVVVDGPNEVWDKDATKAKVLEMLEKHNVHLFMVHFDPEIDASTMRDPLSYWAGARQCRMDNSCDKAPTCGASSDCQAHESCRPAKQYPTTAAGMITETAESYCLPKYTDGRVGPISDYADLACRTNGNYVYVSSVDSLRPFLRNLPSFFNGQWSSEAKLSGLDKTLGAKDGFYRLSGTFVGIFGNESIGDQLSSPIPDTDNPALSSVDNRPMVRVGLPKGR